MSVELDAFREVKLDAFREVKPLVDIDTCIYICTGISILQRHLIKCTYIFFYM